LKLSVSGKDGNWEGYSEGINRVNSALVFPVP